MLSICENNNIKRQRKIT